MTVIDTANRRCFPTWSNLAKWEEKQDVGLPNAVQQNAFQMQIPDPEFQTTKPQTFFIHSYQTSLSRNGPYVLALILGAPALRLRYLLIRIRTPRSTLLFPLSLPMIVVVIVIMSMPTSRSLSPRRPSRPIVPTITITARITRALIARLIDAFRRMIYATNCLS